MTTNPLAKNRRYAQAYGYRDLVVPPGMVMAVVFSQSVEDISENARANLEYIDMRFGVPVCVGDTIEAETLVLGVRGSSKDPTLGVVHVQTTGRNQHGEVVLTFQRKVQVWKKDVDAKLAAGEAQPRDIEANLTIPAYDPSRKQLAHFSSPDTYFEDFTVGDVYEHTRGRVVTTDHIMLTGILDNTSQVHCNQWMVDENPERYVGGQLIVFGGLPVQSLPRHRVGRHRRQRARRRALRDRQAHRADLRGRHGVRGDRDPRQARLSRPARPRCPRVDAPRSQVPQEGRPGREDRDLLPRARAGAEAAQPLRLNDDALAVAGGSSESHPHQDRRLG